KRGYSQKVSAGISWRLEFLSGKNLPDDQPGSNRRGTRVVWWVEKFSVKTKSRRLKRKYLVRRFLKKRLRPFFLCVFCRDHFALASSSSMIASNASNG